MTQALNGLALLVHDPARPVPRPGIVRPRVPDWLPALVNAGRAFITIGAVDAVLDRHRLAERRRGNHLGRSQCDSALAASRPGVCLCAAVRAGNALAAVFAAILAFAVLPQMQTFAGFSVAIGTYLVPAGALMAQPWQTALFAPMAGNLVPLLAPANQMNYDPEQFYNAALALVGGSTVGALAFRLLPPLSPAIRTRRLLSLTLRDLRRLAMQRTRGSLGTARSMAGSPRCRRRRRRCNVRSCWQRCRPASRSTGCLPSRARLVLPPVSIWHSRLLRRATAASRSRIWPNAMRCLPLTVTTDRTGRPRCVRAPAYLRCRRC